MSALNGGSEKSNVMKRTEREAMVRTRATRSGVTCYRLISAK